MRLFRETTGERIDLGDHCRLATGGEARIFVHPDDPQQVVKLWHQPSAERADKVRAMLANPPADPMAAQGHVAIAWPTDRLLTAPQRIVGFLMPRVQGVQPIIDFFNPKTRRQRCPLFNWFYLHRVARNLATALRALHERGYVIGDLNECNILASETALVTVVDTDSFQVWDAAQGRLFRCRVGRPEFTPPELQGKSFAEINRETLHDHFRVGHRRVPTAHGGHPPVRGRLPGTRRTADPAGAHPRRSLPLCRRIAGALHPGAHRPGLCLPSSRAAEPFLPLLPRRSPVALPEAGRPELAVRARGSRTEPGVLPRQPAAHLQQPPFRLPVVCPHDHAGGPRPVSQRHRRPGRRTPPARPRPRTARKQTSGWSLPYPGRPAHGPHPRARGRCHRRPPAARPRQGARRTPCGRRSAPPAATTWVGWPWDSVRSRSCSRCCQPVGRSWHG
ncbi:MAG: hypothetical protein M5U12_25165 [Verrucomicrobia bacterium]|nr:hypothetical protein [Verrucomicrobiota bacterium]